MTPQPGDILLVRDYDGESDLLGELIMAGERGRYGNSQYSVWTHSALIVSTSGDIVEALADGVARTNMAKYNGKEVLVISPPAPMDVRAYACRFAEAQVGDKYGVIDFIGLAASLLTGWDLFVGQNRAYICSGLCARATEAYTDSGYQFPPEAMMPGDLAKFWGAIPTQPLPPLSFIARLLDRVRVLARAISPF